jgi:Na+-driven multidrug efflux pump
VFEDWRPRLAIWKRILAIGLPTGAEFVMTAIYMLGVYTITRPFGAAAQAGFGIGMRVVQSGFMPVVALGFSVAPVAGQNFGARQGARVRETFRVGASMAAGFMLVMGVLCNIAPAALVGIFTTDPAAVDVGVGYLRVASWTFTLSGVMYVASSMFQAMGNTIPSLVSSLTRIVIMAVPSILLSRTPGFRLYWVWYLSAFSVLVQLVLGMTLLYREFGRRLAFPPAPTPEAELPVPLSALGAETADTAPAM